MRLPYKYIFRGRRIRLARHGCANRPFYQIVAIARHRGRDAPYYEQLGTVDPLPNTHGEVICGINFEGIRKWMAKGATLSRPVEKLLGLCGFLPIHYMTFITAKRNSKLNAQKTAETVETSETAETVESSDKIETNAAQTS